jgi:DNA adenine methylase
MSLRAPFPYAGGKSWIAPLVWQRLGPDVVNYVEPCCGSAAMLLARPTVGHIETINDTDGFLVNAYRAIRLAPAETAQWCDWPVVEADLHARHAWLLTQRERLTARLEGNPDYYDAKVAGWWIWGACCWIGSGWCSGHGPWQVQGGELMHLGDAGQGVHRQLVHLGNAGQGVHRQLVHLGNAGRGVHRQLVHLGTAGQEDTALLGYLTALAQRLRSVRITNGDWTRVLGPSVTWRHGVTGIFLDPPYPEEEHSFGYVTGMAVWNDVWHWATTHGDHPQLRIVVCGYEDGRRLPPGWQALRWKARGGYGSQGAGRGRANAAREVLYCSPHCVVPDEELPLFQQRGAPAPRQEAQLSWVESKNQLITGDVEERRMQQQYPLHLERTRATLES